MTQHPIAEGNVGEHTLKISDSCVYTILLGDYELLNEQPVALSSGVPFICLTDNPELRSESWDIRQTTPIFPSDPIRSQRDIKIRPHVHLPDFARSVYIDNGVLLKMLPERLLDMVAESPSGLLVPPHSFRETLLDEFLEVARIGLDENSRIFEQLNHYLLSCPEVLEERPWWSGFIVRDHCRPQLRRALEIWALHVMRYARRDQLSLNVALRTAGMQPLPLPIDNHESEFHSWPHVHGRDRNRGERNHAVSMMPLAGRLRLAETRLQTTEAECKAHAIEIGALREELAELLTERQVREQQLAEFSAERQVHEKQLEELSAERQVHEKELEELSAERQVYAKQLAEFSAAHESLLHSTSWRLTEPLRRLAHSSPRVHRILRKALSIG